MPRLQPTLVGWREVQWDGPLPGIGSLLWRGAGHLPAAEGSGNLAARSLADEDIDGACYSQDDTGNVGSPMAAATAGRSHRMAGAGMVGGEVNRWGNERAAEWVTGMAKARAKEFSFEHIPHHHKPSKGGL